MRIFKKYLNFNFIFRILFFLRFGPLINICNIVGYPECPFKINGGRPLNLILEHFETTHGTPTPNVPFPVIVRRSKEALAFIIFLTFGNDKSVSLSPYFYHSNLGANQNPKWKKEFEVEFSFMGPIPNLPVTDVQSLSWSISPRNLLEADHFPPEMFKLFVPRMELTRKMGMSGKMISAIKVRPTGGKWKVKSRAGRNRRRDNETSCVHLMTLSTLTSTSLSVVREIPQEMGHCAIALQGYQASKCSKSNLK